MAISRRRFIALGAHATFGGLMIYTVRGVWASPLAPTASAESLAPNDYRPESHDWAFVVDTAKCIGCGRCARACKLDKDVPWDPSYNRTWVERYSFMADGDVHVDSPEVGINGF